MKLLRFKQKLLYFRNPSLLGALVEKLKFTRVDPKGADDDKDVQ